MSCHHCCHNHRDFYLHNKNLTHFPENRSPTLKDAWLLGCLISSPSPPYQGDSVFDKLIRLADCQRVPAWLQVFWKQKEAGEPPSLTVWGIELVQLQSAGEWVWTTAVWCLEKGLKLFWQVRQGCWGWSFPWTCSSVWSACLATPWLPSPELREKAMAYADG